MACGELAAPAGAGLLAAVGAVCPPDAPGAGAGGAQAASSGMAALSETACKN